MSSQPFLRLHSQDLLSKYGFNDGDGPESWWDYCDANGIDYANAEFPTAELVRRYLVPRLDQTVTVVEIETCHNPVRADAINGQQILDRKRADREITLTPEYVDVPWDEVIKVARDVGAIG